MQPANPDSYNTIQRRPLDVEDYLDIVRRHSAWILGPVFAGLVVAVVTAFLWPNTYVSMATIRVVPPQVPESLVATNINSQMTTRINSMYQTISSRANLQNIIHQFNLYQKERLRMPLEDVIEIMKDSIRVGQVQSLSRRDREISAFTITFSYGDRLVAQKVTADLTSRFISENIRERTTQSIQTTQFLKDQLDTARKEVESIEDKLANFRQTFQGRLPDQVNQNQQALTNLETRIGNLNNSISRATQEKMLLESDLRNFKTQRASLVPAPEQQFRKQRTDRLGDIDREITGLEASLQALRQRYKDNHPDVAPVRNRLEIARQIRDKMAKQEETERQNEEVSVQSASKKVDPTYEREARSLDAAIERADSLIKAKDAETEGLRKELAAAENQVRTVQSRLDAIPVSDQQYQEIVRDREVAQQKYEELSKKQSQSAMASDLENRQQGETLDVLDPASLPQSPAQPKRPMMILGGIVAGLIIGATLAGAREAKDTSLKNLKDVRAYTQLTILGSVPLLENDLVVRRRKRLSWLAWSTACLVGILIMTGAVFYYYATKV